MTLFIALLVAGLAQAIILSLVILRKKDQRKYPLLLLLGIIGLGLGLRIAYSPAFYLQWVKLVQFSDLALMLYGPAFWFFIRSALQPTTKQDWKRLAVHGIPALLFIIHFAIVIIPISNREFVLEEAAGTFDLYYATLLGVGILLNAAYWWLSFRLVSKGYKTTVQSKHLLKLVLGINGLSIAAWAISYILSFTGPEWYSWLNNAYLFSFIGLAASCITISYYALSNPEFWMAGKAPKKYAKSRLSQEDIETTGRKLESYLIEEKKYLDPGFTLDQLSQGLNINKVQLSQVINQYFQKGFADWVNEHRVEEFIKKAEGGAYKHLTLVGIAMESGFNTKATFNKAFKKAKGTTPSEFIEKQKRKKEPSLSE